MLMVLRVGVVYTHSTFPVREKGRTRVKHGRGSPWGRGRGRRAALPGPNRGGHHGSRGGGGRSGRAGCSEGGFAFFG